MQRMLRGMNLSELLGSSSATLPDHRTDKRSTTVTFDGFLRNLFDEYLHCVDQLEDIPSTSKGVRMAASSIADLASGLVESVAHYLRGFPHAAYEKLRSTLTGVNGWLEPLELAVGISPAQIGEERLYRIRVGKMDVFKRGDLFHVPFHERHKVKSQRYSISGLPSLYLSGSLWACWEEMQRPDFHAIQMSRFRYSAPSKILDFGFRPSVVPFLHDMNFIDDQQIMRYAICWPLIAACSIRASYPEMPFIPEYIIPQLLLQWVRNETNLDGIRYFSTKINQDAHSPWAAMNYVFPVQDQASAGYCSKLQGKFCLTAPCAWSMLTSSSFPGPPIQPDDWTIPVNEDAPVKYFNTTFFECERKLEGLPCLGVDGPRKL